MKIKHLLEGAEPKLPGAPIGIKIMTPQQFVAKSAENDELESEKGVAEGSGQDDPYRGTTPLNGKVAARNGHRLGKTYNNPHSPKYHKDSYAAWDRDYNSETARLKNKGLSESSEGQKFIVTYNNNLSDDSYTVMVSADDEYDAKDKVRYALGMGDRITDVKSARGNEPTDREYKVFVDPRTSQKRSGIYDRPQGMAEATKLPAQTRELKGKELEDYLDRIRTREKGKTDKYKLPYIHRSSVMGYYNEEGKKYDVDAIKQALAQRPKKLLKQNEKMKHSNGELEQFFNIGFAALVGIALDENTNELIVVNTCPGAGSCKVDCFAMKGGKIQFAGPWLSDGRILTYLLNDPDGFFNQLDREIKKEEQAGDKGGYSVTIRWHDAGDFFSPEYVDLAFKLARNNPDVLFYAYTKMGDVALSNKPANFIINWSEGAHTSQEKKVKSADPSLEKTKNSRIIPSNLFYDLLVKDEKKNLVKGPEGQWQVIPDKLPELKQRLAKAYNISASSILGYDEWAQKTDSGKQQTPVKYNVIITPGEPDITAKSHGVLSTLLLKH